MIKDIEVFHLIRDESQDDWRLVKFPPEKFLEEIKEGEIFILPS